MCKASGLSLRSASLQQLFVCPQLEKEIKKLTKEIENLEEEFLQKTNSLKLAETRLENRILRPGAELVHDEPQIELGKEVLALRKVREELAERIAKAK